MLQIYGTFKPTLLNPIDRGWYNEGCRLIAEMTRSLPAPKANIEMSVCNCRSGKTKCTSGNCTCQRNGLKCSEMCRCKDCENTEEFAMAIGVADDESDELMN